MFKCPHCGKKTISGWEKLGLGFFKNVTCGECGAKLKVPFQLFYLLPILATLSLALRLLDISAIWFLIYSIAITIIMVFVYLKYIPLVPRIDNQEL